MNEENKNEPVSTKRKQFRKSPGQYNRDQYMFGQHHQEWRSWTFRNKRGFFPVFTPEFTEKLKNVSGNAIKLYLYLGAHINNKEGSTTVSVEKIASDLNATKRTVHNWFAELREHELAIRIQPGFKNTTTTYLLPYHDDFLKTRPSIVELIKEYSSEEQPEEEDQED